MSILGDQHDREYPVYHNDASKAWGELATSWTLCTAYFDVAEKKVSIILGNPSPTSVSHDSKYGVSVVYEIKYDDDENVVNQLDRLNITSPTSLEVILGEDEIYS